MKFKQRIKRNFCIFLIAATIVLCIILKARTYAEQPANYKAAPSASITNVLFEDDIYAVMERYDGTFSIEILEYVATHGDEILYKDNVFNGASVVVCYRFKDSEYNTFWDKYAFMLGEFPTMEAAEEYKTYCEGSNR